MDGKNNRPPIPNGVEITQVANGYILRPTQPWFAHGDRCWGGSAPEYFVFQSFGALATFLAVHFTHRAGEDAVNKKAFT